MTKAADTAESAGSVSFCDAVYTVRPLSGSDNSMRSVALRSRLVMLVRRTPTDALSVERTKRGILGCTMTSFCATVSPPNTPTRMFLS